VTHAYDLFPPNVRNTDPASSHDGATHIQPKRLTHADRLYMVYQAYPEGLTDEEAGRLAPEIPGAWKRSADLRKSGRIVDTGRTRPGVAGVQQMVCRCAT
jgi:hypothetical protein